jgi:hypothetical protein
MPWSPVIGPLTSRIGVERLAAHHLTWAEQARLTGSVVDFVAPSSLKQIRVPISNSRAASAIVRPS